VKKFIKRSHFWTRLVFVVLVAMLLLSSCNLVIWVKNPNGSVGPTPQPTVVVVETKVVPIPYPVSPAKPDGSPGDCSGNTNGFPEVCTISTPSG
jgi:hypothetical protein